MYVFSTRLVFATLVLLLALPERAFAEESKKFVLESYVGARPRYASDLLAPLLDELKVRGFKNSSVVGTRIESQHSVSAAQLSNKQIESARRLVKEGSSSYINTRYEGAIEASSQGLAILMSRPSTMALQQHVRELLYEALITIALAQSRLGNEEALIEAMGEFIRSFPDKEVSRARYGFDGIELYRKINRLMQKKPKGELHVAAGEGDIVFINERYEGMGSLTRNLFPGRYRVYIQRGSATGRVHIVEVVGEHKQLVIDPIADRTLHTSDFVGFLFETEAERVQHEQRLALQLGQAIGADTMVLVGFQSSKGQDFIIAQSIAIDGDARSAARFSIPPDAAPPPSKLRALAAVVAGERPASPGIEVLSAPAIPQDKGATQSGAIASRSLTRGQDSSPEGKGHYATWRWLSLGAGAVSLGVGGYLVAIDGNGTCALEAGQLACPQTYETVGTGLALMGAGVVFTATGLYLWSREEKEAKARHVTLAPTRGGVMAGFSSTF